MEKVIMTLGLKERTFQGSYPFNDSDVFKIMEGAAFLLAVQKDEELDTYMDSLIYLIGEAQEPNGYLYTNRTIAANPLFTAEYNPQLLGGTNGLRGTSTVYKVDIEKKEITPSKGEITLIPYPLRSHGGTGEMVVWIPEKAGSVKSK